jgi:hypothetical protein
MYSRSNTGHSNPGWYAGAKMIRRIAANNPRLFLRIMDDLFTKSQKTKLTPKRQSDTILHFSKAICDETLALEVAGPEVANKLKYISEILQKKTHDEPLQESGTTFRLDSNNYEDEMEWIAVAIANSRLNLDMKSLKLGLSKESEFSLANIYAVYYWIPMRRNSNPPLITVSKEQQNEALNTYIVRKPKPRKSAEIPGQTSIIEERHNDEHK